MARLIEPTCERIKFCEPVKQNGWNETCYVDSTAIQWFAYNPKTKVLLVVFQRNKWKGKRFRAGLYEYVEVPISAVNDFIRCPYERKKTLPSRVDSVGASFRRAIGRYTYDYRRYLLPDWLRKKGIKD